MVNVVSLDLPEKPFRGDEELDVTVAHPSLNRAGGAEKVCLTFVKALLDGGYRVKLATVDRTDWDMLEARFGITVRPREEAYLVGSTYKLGIVSQAAATALLFPLILLSSRSEEGLLVNTYGELTDRIADLAYVNSIPVKLAYRYRETGFPSSTVWRAALQAYGDELRLSHVGSKSILIANSRFIQAILRRGMNRSSILLYPPVEVEVFREASEGVEKRRGMVVVVSRVRPGKKLGVMLKIAKLVEDAEFLLLAIADRGSKDTLEKLRGLTELLDVEDRVRILVNQPFRRYVEALASASVYLHTQPSEAFGISVVEAMAAGCVPIVPRSGGPWIDILSGRQGLYGFSYRDVHEAACKVKMLIENGCLRREVAVRASLRASDFDRSIFEAKGLSIVEKICEREA